jgi:alpha-N-arabinofuranosidase
LDGRIEIFADQPIGAINPDIYGHFTELVYRCFYGGLWAEMLSMRKFEGDDGEGDQYGVVKPWYPIGRTPHTRFMHDNTHYYCGVQSQKIASQEKKERRVGIGQRGLYLEKARKYQVRVNLCHDTLQSPVVIALEGEQGIYAREEFDLSEGEWSRFEFTLTPSHSDRNASFTITFQGSGTLWIGTASLMPADHLSGFRKDVVEAVQEINPPNIRWPGGNFVSYYNWEDGIGDRDRRPPRPNHAYLGAQGEEWEGGKPWEPNDVGIDEFLELCRILGAKPYVAVNAGNGTPEEAAHLVEYCNGSSGSAYGAKRAANGRPEPYSVELWGIGNEMFGNWQGGHVDDETYARRHLAIAKAMRAVDPSIKLVGTGGRYWFYPGWNQALFQIAGDNLDYLSLHSYAKKYRNIMKKEDLENPEFAKEFYYYIVSSPHGIEEQIDLTAKEIQLTFKDTGEVSVAFDEWNCWAYRAPRFEVEFALRDGLYTAGVLHAFRRQCNVLKLANFSMTVNCLPMIRVNQEGMFFNPQYLVFKMYMNHQGPILVRSRVDCDTYPAPEYEKGRPQAIGQIPYLDTSATLSEDGRKLYLAVINRHDSETIETGIDIKGWESTLPGKILWLAGEHYMTENSFDLPDQVRIEESTIEDVKTSFTHRFEPHSVTIFEFHQDKTE